MDDIGVARRSHKQQADSFGPPGVEHSANTVRHIFQPPSNGEHALTCRLADSAVVERKRGGSR